LLFTCVVVYVDVAMTTEYHRRTTARRCVA